MEVCRLLLRSLSDVPRGQRITALCDEYRSNMLFMLRHGDALPNDLLVRLNTTQDALAEATRREKPTRRADTARQIALRAWRSLISGDEVA